MTVPFGSVLRESSFQFSEDVNNLNHGSYGACPREVMDACVQGMMRELSFPDKFYRYELADTTLAARKAFSKELNCDVNDVVCAPNATYALNNVSRFIANEWNDVIYFSTIYGSCKNMLTGLSGEYKIDLHEIKVPVSIESPQFFVDQLSSKIRELKAKAEKAGVRRHKAVIFETVTSMPSIALPWKELVKLCIDLGATSIVDGAHGIGLTKIDLNDADPDFFVTNAHKWFYSAHSCAALYVHKSQQPTFRNMIYGPTLVGEKDYQQGSSSWTDNFDSIGTMNYSGVCAVPAAASFCENELGGVDKVIEYQNKSSKEASSYLVSEWNTTLIADFGDEYRTALFSIVCPYEPPEYQKRAFTEFAAEHLYEVYHTYIPIVLYDDQILMRFSAAVYLELDDFKEGKLAVDKTIEYFRKHYENKPWVR